MPPPIHINIAQPQDIPALCHLLGTLFAQEQEFSPDRAAQQQGLEQILSDANLGFIMTATMDNQIVGMVNVLFSVSTALGARVALLEDMVVSDKFRGRGIGSALLQAAISEAGRQGCKRITLLTDTDNTAAQRFYQRHGFVASTMLAMRLIL
ncbi:MAG: GNAT family N-acetyltransferase [Methylococcales bacterium]